MVGCVDESLITRLMGRLRTSNNLGQLCKLYSFISFAVSFKVYNSITRRCEMPLQLLCRVHGPQAGCLEPGLLVFFMVCCVCFICKIREGRRDCFTRGRRCYILCTARGRFNTMKSFHDCLYIHELAR